MVDPDVVLARLCRDPRRAAAITHVEHVPARLGQATEWPTWAPASVIEAFGSVGIQAPWAHQTAAAERAHAGESVVLATGTASGKSLGYLLPVLSALTSDDRARALYLAPTKALAGDQLRAVRALAVPGVRASTFDGDTAPEERDWVRAHATYVLTNPDMVHRSLLPQHQRWTPFLRGLRFVVIDECHTYRGVFGSNVAAVLRRLRRLCARYGSSPVFLLASATTSAPADSARRLTGVPVTAVSDDASPRGACAFALYEPPVTDWAGDQGAPVRRSATAECADLLADLVLEGVRTLAFVRSRRGAESVAASAKRSLAEVDASLATRVAAYRAGYLPEERRELEAALQSGRLLGVAATSALELGVDVSGLDAVLMAGFPGTLSSLWQQAGRAGRDGQGALAVLVARDDPLDNFLVHHPETVFGRPVEATVLDPDNPYVLAPHLAAAAAELPLTEDDLALFGPSTPACLDGLVAAGQLRKRPSGWYWTHRERPAADLRGTGGSVVLVEDVTGRVLGSVNAGAAHSQTHPGALYLHQGVTFLVESLDLDSAVAVLRPAEPDWTTTARDVTEIRLVESLLSGFPGDVVASFGTVDVTNQVVSYLRRRLITGEILAEEPLDLPPRHLRTRAVYYTLSERALAGAGLAPAQVPGAAHAAEHAAIGMLPLFATCDRWDIGGVSTSWHEDTGAATVFVYDGHPGGAGFAERGYARIEDWLTATRAVIKECSCPAGCPSCIQSPKCGNGNEPLDKADAVRLLDVVLAALT